MEAGRRQAPTRSHRWGQGRCSLLPQDLGQIQWVDEGSGALPETASSLFPGPPSSLTGPRPGELEGCRGGQDSPLTSLYTRWPPFHRRLAEWPTDGCSLTVGCLWEGSTVVSTNGWAGQPTVTHWQLVACGGVQVMAHSKFCVLRAALATCYYKAKLQWPVWKWFWPYGVDLEISKSHGKDRLPKWC